MSAALLILSWLLRNIHWIVLGVGAFVAINNTAHYKSELAKARSEIALLEAEKKRNADAAMAAQYDAVVRNQQAGELSARVEAYARDLMAMYAEQQQTAEDHNKEIAGYEQKLATRSCACAPPRGCALDSHDVERLRAIQ